ncbi:MAG: 3-hydroxyacyl-CoA dehydrogenase NAD-binding domain-containing protein [Proteobacteria bacterium]|nr:3-hydroxyacyl-CoA dehydrogenase NAD-binding domain-containing protein [Pseudomonadota bacterium]
MTTATHYFSWQVHDSVAILEFKNTRESVNILHEEALRELDDHLTRLTTNTQGLVGLVISSGMTDHFIVGADIKDIELLRNSQDDPEKKVAAGATYMQDVFQKLADLPMKTVCAIHGRCLGGGLELALACDYRVVSSDPKTKLGFPEVQLGLMPGAGGTQRLPRLIGIVPAINLITTARNVSGKKAFQLGLASTVTSPYQLLSWAIKIANNKTRPSFVKKRRSQTLFEKVLGIMVERNPLSRKVIFYFAKKKISEKTKNAYPAPLIALKSIFEGYQLPLNLGLKKEAKYFAQLALTRESSALIHLFHATNHLKKSPYAQPTPAESPNTKKQTTSQQPSPSSQNRHEPSSDSVDYDHAPGTHKISDHLVDQSQIANHGTAVVAKEDQTQDEMDSINEVTEKNKELLASSFNTSETDAMNHGFNKVGLVGGGFMGSGIATLCAVKGIPTVITDPSAAALGRVYQYAQKFLRKRVQRRRMKSFEMGKAMMSIAATQNSDELRCCPFVIEAVFENLKLKQDILQNLEAQASDNWVFASNTSAIPISNIAAAAKHPNRVVGMHFFSPAEKMPLCEIVKTSVSDHSAIHQAYQLAQKLGKQVICVNDGNGFYTTRTLAFFLAEAIRLLEEGVKVEDIDQAMTQFGFPVGPLTLMDEVGLDVGYHVLSTMIKAFPGRIYSSSHVEQMITKKFLGRKTKKGIYLYQKVRGKKGSTDLKKAGVNPDIQQIFQIKKEASLSAYDIQKRLSLIFINESVRCLDEQILASAYDGDVGAVFGLGFPPFLGGPFFYADQLGAQNIVDDLTKLQKTLGAGFQPAEQLIKNAKESRSFY